jgi:hypothetical protein
MVHKTRFCFTEVPLDLWGRGGGVEGEPPIDNSNLKNNDARQLKDMHCSYTSKGAERRGGLAFF